MNRREVIQSLGLVTTHVMFPSILSGFLVRCSQPEKETYSLLFFDENEFEQIKKIIDIIIPETTTKSASQAGVQNFMDEVFAKCLNPEQQTYIKNGITELISKFSEADDKNSFLSEVDRKAFTNDDEYAYFKTIKQYTLVGYFTSQEGETKASNYIKFPGDYQGDITLDEKTLNYGDTTLRYYL